MVVEHKTTLREYLTPVENKPKGLDWLNAQLHALSNHKFFGSVEIIFEDGKVQRIIKKESIKP